MLRIEPTCKRPTCCATAAASETCWYFIGLWTAANFDLSRKKYPHKVIILQYKGNLWWYHGCFHLIKPGNKKTRLSLQSLVRSLFLMLKKEKDEDFVFSPCCLMGSGSLSYLKLAIWREDANPLIIIICNDDVSAGVDSHTSGPLQLPRGTSSNAKTAFELSIVGKDLGNKWQSLESEFEKKSG